MHNQQFEADQRTPAQVERELKATRNELDNTLTELEHKISTSYLAERIQQRTLEAMAAGRELAARYPIAVGAAFAVGAGALLVSRRRRSRNADWARKIQQLLEEGRQASSAGSRARLFARSAGQEAQTAMQTIAHDATVRGQQALSEAGRFAQQQATRVGQTLQETQVQQPLLYGVALGVLAATLGRRLL